MTDLLLTEPCYARNFADMRSSRALQVALRPARLLPCRHALPAVATLAPAHDPPAPVRARGNHAEVLTATIAAFQAALVGFRVRSRLFHIAVHSYLLRKSSCV